MTTADWPLIVDIKRHSLEDGPGIRSVIFFKGCSLNCIFCQNPEAQDQDVEIAFTASDCISCGACLDACEENAVDLKLPHRIHRIRCNRCGKCADVCPGGGLRRIGERYSPQSLTEIVLRDYAFYRHSGGGITLSGGESTMYPDYVLSLLQLLKARKIHVALETCGYFEYPVFRENILPYLDLIFFDIKLIDSQSHRKLTGKSNQKILDNFRRLMSECEIEVRPRIPLIPGVTATRENLSAVLDFLCSAGADSITPLPYNPLGMKMRVNLGKPMPGNLPNGFMEADEERELISFIKKTSTIKLI